MPPVQSIINHELHFELLSACMVRFIFASSTRQYVTCLSFGYDTRVLPFYKTLFCPLFTVSYYPIGLSEMSFCLLWRKSCQHRLRNFIKVFWNKVWYYVTYNRTPFLPQNSNCMWQNNQWYSLSLRFFFISKNDTVTGRGQRSRLEHATYETPRPWLGK